MSNPDGANSPDELVQDEKLVEEALARGVRDALRRHKQAGNPVPESRDGKIQWIPADEIPVSSEGQELDADRTADPELQG